MLRLPNEERMKKHRRAERMSSRTGKPHMFYTGKLRGWTWASPVARVPVEVIHWCIHMDNVYHANQY